MLVVSLSVSAIFLFYLWILTVDLSNNSGNNLSDNSNFKKAAESIKTLPSFWQVVKSSSNQLIDLFKEGIFNYSSSTVDILESPTPSPDMPAMPNQAKLPLSD